MIISKSIISGIDLGPDTEKVISYTAYFAAKTRAEVRLLYVIDYLMTPPSYLAAYIDEEKRREESEMEEWKVKLKEEGIKAESEIVLGHLHESFVKVIEEESPELLVIGYQSHMLRPSSSERLIKSLQIPMLVVRGRFADKAVPGPVSIRNILCPVDFSENSRHAISAAKELASLFSADLHLCHVIPSHLLKEKKAVWKSLGKEDREKFDDTMRLEAESQFVLLCNEYGIDNGGEIFHGAPASVISSISEEREYDLIVMGARGLSYMQTVLIGSTTEAVLKTSPCPVLIVH